MDYMRDWVGPLVEDVLNTSIGVEVPNRSRNDRRGLSEPTDDGTCLRLIVKANKFVQVEKWTSISNPIQARFSDSFTSIRAIFSTACTDRYKQKSNKPVSHGTKGGLLKLEEFEIVVSYGNNPDKPDISLCVHAFDIVGCEGTGVFGRPVYIISRRGILKLVRRFLHYKFVEKDTGQANSEGGENGNSTRRLDVHRPPTGVPTNLESFPELTFQPLASQMPYATQAPIAHDVAQGVSAETEVVKSKLDFRNALGTLLQKKHPTNEIRHTSGSVPPHHPSPKTRALIPAPDPPVEGESRAERYDKRSNQTPVQANSLSPAPCADSSQCATSSNYSVSPSIEGSSEQQSEQSGRRSPVVHTSSTVDRPRATCKADSDMDPWRGMNRIKRKDTIIPEDQERALDRPDSWSPTTNKRSSVKVNGPFTSGSPCVRNINAADITERYVSPSGKIKRTESNDLVTPEGQEELAEKRDPSNSTVAGRPTGNQDSDSVEAPPNVTDSTKHADSTSNGINSWRHMTRIRRRDVYISKEQENMIEKPDSWIPPATGKRTPQAHVPIALLKQWNDFQTRNVQAAGRPVSPEATTVGTDSLLPSQLLSSSPGTQVSNWSASPVRDERRLVPPDTSPPVRPLDFQTHQTPPPPTLTNQLVHEEELPGDNVNCQLGTPSRPTPSSKHPVVGTHAGPVAHVDSASADSGPATQYSKPRDTQGPLANAHSHSCREQEAAQRISTEQPKVSSGPTSCIISSVLETHAGTVALVNTDGDEDDSELDTQARMGLGTVSQEAVSSQLGSSNQSLPVTQGASFTQVKQTPALNQSGRHYEKPNSSSQTQILCEDTVCKPKISPRVLVPGTYDGAGCKPQSSTITGRLRQLKSLGMGQDLDGSLLSQESDLAGQQLTSDLDIYTRSSYPERVDETTYHVGSDGIGTASNVSDSSNNSSPGHAGNKRRQDETSFTSDASSPPRKVPKHVVRSSVSQNIDAVGQHLAADLESYTRSSYPKRVNQPLPLADVINPASNPSPPPHSVSSAFPARKRRQVGASLTSESAPSRKVPKRDLTDNAQNTCGSPPNPQPCLERGQKMRSRDLPFATRTERIFNMFKQTYPSYNGDIHVFKLSCQKLHSICDQEWMKRSVLWDDFVGREVMEYREYIEQCQKERETADPYEVYFRQNVTKARFRKRNLTRRNLEVVIAECESVMEEKQQAAEQSSNLEASQSPIDYSQEHDLSYIAEDDYKEDCVFPLVANDRQHRGASSPSSDDRDDGSRHLDADVEQTNERREGHGLSYIAEDDDAENSRPPLVSIDKQRRGASCLSSDKDDILQLLDINTEQKNDCPLHNAVHEAMDTESLDDATQSPNSEQPEPEPEPQNQSQAESTQETTDWSDYEGHETASVELGDGDRINHSPKNMGLRKRPMSLQDIVDAVPHEFTSGSIEVQKGGRGSCEERSERSYESGRDSHAATDTDTDDDDVVMFDEERHTVTYVRRASKRKTPERSRAQQKPSHQSNSTPKKQPAIYTGPFYAPPPLKPSTLKRKSRPRSTSNQKEWYKDPNTKFKNFAREFVNLRSGGGNAWNTSGKRNDTIPVDERGVLRPRSLGPLVPEAELEAIKAEEALGSGQGGMMRDMGWKLG